MTFSILLVAVLNLSLAQDVSPLQKARETCEQAMMENDGHTLLNSSEIYLKHTDPTIQADGLYWYALGYELTDQPKKALRAYYKALDRYQYLNDTTSIARVYGAIAVVYYNHDKPTAKDYLLKSASIYQLESGNGAQQELAQTYLNLANVYLSIYGEDSVAIAADSAKYYFNTSSQMLKEFNPSPWVDFSLKLIDVNLTFLQGLTCDENFTENSNRLLDSLGAIKDSVQFSLICSAKAHYYNGLEDYSSALHWSQMSLSHLPANGNIVFRYDFYGLRSQIFKNKGETDSAFYYLERTNLLEEDIEEVQGFEDLKAISVEEEKEDQRLMQKFKFDRSEDEMTTKISDQQKTLLIVSALTFVLLFALLIFKRRKLRLERALDTESKRNRAANFQLNQYESKIQEITQQKEAKESIHQVSAQILLDECKSKISSIKTISDDSVKLDLILEVMSRYPELTNTEISLCIYLISGLTSKEIAQIENIEPASVDRRRYRLRKKIGLDSSVQIHSFLRSINQ